LRKRQRYGSQPQHNGSGPAEVSRRLAQVHIRQLEKDRTVNARPVLLVALAAALAAGACGSPDTTDEVDKPVSAAKPTPSAQDLLLKSVPGADSGSVRFATTGSDPTSGIMDAARHTVQIDMTQKDSDFTLTMNFLFVERQSWVKINLRGAPGLPKIPKKWMLLDPSKLKNGPDAIPIGYDNDTDPGDAGTMLQSAADVRQTSPGHFTGTTDLSRTGDGDVTDAKTLAALGATAKAVPFEAVTDGQGRLRSMVVKIPKTTKTKASTYAVTYRDYGTAPTPRKPSAGEQQKAPSIVYQMLNG
jgi:hypothetical protein